MEISSDVEKTTERKLSNAIDALLQSTGARNGQYIECCTYEECVFLYIICLRFVIFSAYHACIGSGLSLTGSTVHRILMERVKLYLSEMRCQLNDMKVC